MIGFREFMIGLLIIIAIGTASFAIYKEQKTRTRTQRLSGNIEHFKYRGHSYIYFREDRSISIVKDPDCELCKLNDEKTGDFIEYKKEVLKDD